MLNAEDFEALVKEIPDDLQPPPSIYVRVRDYVWNKLKQGYSLFKSHVWPTMTAIMTTYMVLTPFLTKIRVNNEDELIMAIARGYGIGRSGSMYFNLSFQLFHSNNELLLLLLLFLMNYRKCAN